MGKFLGGKNWEIDIEDPKLNSYGLYHPDMLRTDEALGE